MRHILTAKTNDSGKPGDVHLRILLIFQKEGGSWKLLARQAVKWPNLQQKMQAEIGTVPGNDCVKNSCNSLINSKYLVRLV